MNRRIVVAVLTACLAGAMTLLGVSTGAAADADRLPILPGPAEVVRQPSAATPRIVGGTPVAHGKFTFQAALLAQSFGDDDRQRQFCGGSLISPNHVLTAAHCAELFGNRPDQLPLTELRVVVGRTVLTSTQGQKRRVASIALHPRWDPHSFSHDAAVVTLAAPVNGIRPVSLVTPGTDALERPGSSVTVTGWGNTIAQPAGPGGGGVQLPDRLQQAQMPIVGAAECRTAYAAAGAPINATMLCAGRTNLDACQGDSGGPLFVRAAGSARYIQVGVTSWGVGCGATGFPGVYTRLGNRSIGNFILTATGGVPVKQAA